MSKICKWDIFVTNLGYHCTNPDEFTGDVDWIYCNDPCNPTKECFKKSEGDDDE